jgi:hypothetical protein
MSETREQDRQIVKMLVRAREDFQDMRKRMDNRIGRKADGQAQDLENADRRVMAPEDVGMFSGIADAAHSQEAVIEKEMKKVLKRFPIYTEWLKGVKGVGPIAAGWIVGEYDIHRADTVSKLWQFTGLNPGMVRGKKRVPATEKAKWEGRILATIYGENKKPEHYIVASDQMVRGDKLTPGHVAPFNKRLRTALVGVMADGFIKAQNEYCMQYYYPYKTRLEAEESTVEEVAKAGAKSKAIAWKDAKKGHRDRAAKRYMIKMFLKDLYAAWRAIEGLPVREPYQVEYLGKKHVA